ncbi:AAA family ATPase [Leifsonia poae]|uniref:AAA family ATPase n=1 Tax=Leifsonia poae TaxID=110933 RepID=UPI001CC0B205|nr:ATP-binding protein [Leifsonia poae]
MALTLMCGLSFSGKSTVAAQLAEQLPGSVISLDRINAERGLDGGLGIPLEEWVLTKQIAHERAESLLRAGQQVVVDDTGSPRFIRDEWRTLAERSGTPLALVWVQIDPVLQQERVQANRSEQRRHDVIDSVLEDHVTHFEPPVDEAPIIIDAEDTTNEARIADIVDAIRRRTTTQPGEDR